MDMAVNSIHGRPKHYLVTGGCGFIGSHLVDSLIEDGHSVTVIDDLSSGKRENLNPRATLIIGDTVDFDMVARAMENADGCFHLAAIASVEKSNKEWRRTHMVNVVSTINVFLAASGRSPTIPVVYASSAATYGNCAVIPTPETAATKPLTAYGADKLACDHQGNVAWLVHSVPNIGMRFFNVYGPRQDPKSPYSGVISIFMDRMMQGLPITINGDGKQIRDFVYVGDVVRALSTAMGKLHDPWHACHDVINVCTGRPTTIKELADSIALATGRTLKYNYGPARKGDIYVSIGDPSHLAYRLGVKMWTTLADGLPEIVDYAMATDGGYTEKIAV